jgi:hypothetical protein
MGSSPGAKRGDVELFNNFVQDPMPKLSGSGSAFEIENGLILVQDVSVTPSVLKIAGAGAAGPHFMSRGARVKITDAYVLSDNGTVLAALDTDSIVSAVKSGRCLLEFTNTCTPNDRVMTDTGGKVKKYDGSGQDKIVGTYKHKPGEGDGKTAPSVITSGLGWVDLGEGR